MTNTQGPGFILIYPAGGTQPTVSTLNYVAGQTIANAAVVPLGTGGAVTVIAGVSGTDLILDTNGYFSSTLGTPGNFFELDNNSTLFTMVLNNASTTCVGPCGLDVSVSHGTAIVGNSASTGDGIRGLANATTGGVTGVLGVTFSFSSDSAGVVGVGGSGAPSAVGVSGGPGVWGASKFGIGVSGASQNRAVVGNLTDSVGSMVSTGILGGFVGTNAYGVYSFGNYGGTGAKFFVEPHPTDASKIIRYVALEGPESGTYFRGSGRTVRGQAVIEVPESFRMVTDEEGLTVQLTPIGPLAMMSVESEDLSQIVVRSSKDVTFHYLVQGVRRAFKGYEAIVDGGEFMPRSADDHMPGYLTQEARSRLIANGTWNPDGTVKMETAERLGWAKMWADREAQAKATAAANAAAHAAMIGDRRQQLPGSP